MLESSGVVSGVGSEGNKRSLEDEGSSSKEGSSSSATPSSKRAKQDLQSLPTRQYLDQTVVPILLQVPETLFNRDTNQSQSLTGPRQFGEGTTTGSNRIFGRLPDQVFSLNHLFTFATAADVRTIQAQARVWSGGPVEADEPLCWHLNCLPANQPIKLRGCVCRFKV